MNVTAPACEAPGVSVSGKIALLKACICSASEGVRTEKENAPLTVRVASNSDQHSDASIQSLRLIGMRCSIYLGEVLMSSSSVDAPYEENRRFYRIKMVGYE